MATYVYETIPSDPKSKPRRFEVERNYSGPLDTFRQERTAVEGIAQVIEHIEPVLAQG